MLKLTSLTFCFLFNDIAEMLDEIGNIMRSFHFLSLNSHDIVLAIKVDIAQINVPQFSAKLKQSCSNLYELTSLYFGE